jgi:hypothetical protein
MQMRVSPTDETIHKISVAASPPVMPSPALIACCQSTSRPCTGDETAVVTVWTPAPHRYHVIFIVVTSLASEL